MDETAVSEGRRPLVQRTVIFAGAVIFTAFVVALALLVGNWAFRHKQLAMHEARLARLLPLKPTLDQIVAGLEGEGAPLIATPKTPKELQRFVADQAGSAKDQMLAKANRWPTMRVFAAGDVLYVIFFDDDSVMRDFACVWR